MIHNDDIEMNAAADHAAPAAHGHGNVAPAAEELNNVHDVSPMTPPQVQLHNTEEDIIEIIQSVEHVSALKGLITSIVGNATDIIPRLHGYQITAARCNIMDVDDPMLASGDAICRLISTTLMLLWTMLSSRLYQMTLCQI